MDIMLTADSVSVASSRHNGTNNHDCYRKQMAVISECANIRECSSGSRPITSHPHS